MIGKIDFVFASRVQLIHLVETNLISKHIKQMLSKGFDQLIDENRLNSVTLLYELFLPLGLPAINDLREAFGNYIKVMNRKACEQTMKN